MYLYLCTAAARTDAERLLADALFDYSERKGPGLSRREAECAPRGTGSYGKPYFIDIPNAHFSVSHSGRVWACLMSETEVGLDVEDIAARRDRSAAGETRYLKPARRCFAEDERRYVEFAAMRGAEELAARFFFVWTRKEAYVKYTGRGLGAGFGSFSVLDGGLGVFFGAARARTDLAVAYCRADEAQIEKTVFF
jgi:hypothetical protein